MALRPATGEDWAAIAGYQPPASWFGYVEQTRPWVIDGLGAVYLGTDGRHWITFWRTPGVSKVKTAHAAAKKLLAEAKDKGLTVHGMADPKMSGAVLWMQRLGFKRTDETIGGIEVWTL